MLKATDSLAAEVGSGVLLDQLFSGSTRTGTGQVVANSCTSDCRQVQPGDIYVALPATGTCEEDGHDYAREAADKGAIAIVCERPVPVFNVPTYLVDDSRVAYGQLCQKLSGSPSQTLPVIAVTGTHGKSTTIALLESIFAMAGNHCGRISSLGTYDGISFSPGLDNPSAPELANRLERMVAAGCSHALVEVSSLALSQESMAGIEFDAVCVTNVSEAHLNIHNSLQSYRKLKRRVLEYLSPQGITILNADDPVSSKWLTNITGPVLTYGTKGQAEITAEIIEVHSNEQIFLISAGNESVAVRTTMVGEQHVANCLAAAAMALSYGINLQTIAAGIEALPALPGRMERVDCAQGFPVFMDAADTAESLRVCLRTARRCSPGRVICVLGDTSSATYSEELAIAHVVRRMSDLAVVTRPFPEEEELVQDSQKQAVVEIVENRAEAIACAIAIAQPDDIVVIAGSQTDPQWAYGTLPVESSHDEREVVRQLLLARQESSVRLVA